MEKRTKNNLYKIAKTVLDKITDREKPFDKITLVFHSAKIAQWFKAYFLKTNNSILMNVDFVTLSAFINDILNPTDEKHILTVSEYREYIIKALLNGKNDDEIFKYFRTENDISGINLYEFADKLASVIFNMEFDNEEITNVWQKAIYEKANEYAEAQGNYTPKRIFEVTKDNLSKIDGKVYVVDNSYISALYGVILENFENVTVFSLDKTTQNNAKVELYSAPSIMREVEWLHTEICKKMKDCKSSVGSFAVYAPNINDYANTIRRVFQRSKAKFPEVPFRIIGEGTEKRDMITALNILYDIANKGFFTRYDLQKFIKLPMIMFINDLTNDDLDAFKKAIETTNTHRNGDDVTEFEDFKKRLLLSMLAGGVVSLKDKEYLTYSTIDMDECRINKLIDMIDKLSAWAGLFKGELSKQMLDNNALESIADSLNALFSHENTYGEEKNYLYTDVRTEMEKIIAVFSDTEIPAITLLLLLQDAPNRYTSSPADVFAGGVTFLSLGIDNIVPEENVYVLGLSSNNFPRVEDRTEIDFSEKHIYTHKLDTDAFNNLLKNADNVAVSFVNRDLKTDEEFFPSTVIPLDVREDYNKKKDTDAEYIKEHIISLDEDREIKELFTYRELLNKLRVANMGKEVSPAPETGEAENGNEKKTAENIPEIKTSQIKKYLENTIVYKYSEMLKDSKDEDKSKSEEYEIIDLDGLEKYDIVKQMILAAMEENDNPTEEVHYNEFHKKVLNKMRLENKLPKDFAEEYFKEYFDNSAKPVINILKDGYEKVDEFSLDMESGTKKWTLKMNTLCFVKEDGQNLSFIEPREQGNGAKYFLPPYVCALANVASKNGDVEYHITLITKNKEEFSVNSEYAKNILNEIFNAIQDLDSIKYMDIEFIEDIRNESVKIIEGFNKKHSKEKITFENYTKDNKEIAEEISLLKQKIELLDKICGYNEITAGSFTDDEIEILSKNGMPNTISSLMKAIAGHDAWQYFNDSKLLIPDVDFGYGSNEILPKMLVEYKKISNMILYYSDEKSQTEGGNVNV